MGGFVFRRVQEGYNGEPAITRERKHFSKIHPSDCKPSTRLACSYLNWSEEVSAALCSAVDRTNERMNEHMFETLGIVQLACKHAIFLCFILLKRTSYCCAVQCNGLGVYKLLGVTVNSIKPPRCKMAV